MALTAIEICSNALIRLGANPIQSFTEGTDIATACEVIYNQKKAFALTSYPWRFSMAFAQLSRLTATPTAQWTYQYALPSDRVQDGPAGVFLSDNVGDSPTQDFNIVGKRLVSNDTELYIKYQKDVEEEDFPPYFTELMIGIMLVEICYLVTDNNSLRQELKLEVYGSPGENGLGGLVGAARQIDSRDTPTLRIVSDFFLNIRE